MIFTATPLAGAFIVDVEPHSDERGLFARTYCAEEFRARGLADAMLQISVSFNARRATLRGMHYQASPHEEDKLVRCTAGAIFDVIVDIRPGSASYKGWFGAELTADNRRAVYVPKGFAHGFLSLRDASEVLYLMSVPEVAAAGRGFAWNDPAIGIDWPLEPLVMSARDAIQAPFDPAQR
jgi:dTDP-4-dehydrorhamnose 3,5-epimerase